MQGQTNKRWAPDRQNAKMHSDCYLRQPTLGHAPTLPLVNPPDPTTSTCCRMAPCTSFWMVSLVFSRMECGSVQMNPASTSLTLFSPVTRLIQKAVHTHGRCIGQDAHAAQAARPAWASEGGRVGGLTSE
ncbi:hypothetical protein F751_6960 [Auxenochlorella protothecoides]|uniref:Uncharacterized protein n=1 Tax=Auxenochlorella protothecoides TaxID=3075 RepID=A0A087SR39_AUXPR|nr:hypothetical protein F751_6960 [Auxenochlorella protothecoides]KFM28193.1 hypothetical protein F751_6960 [Auxenochlorella protothecoides]